MAVHVYGVTTADAPEPPMKGRRDADLRFVTDDGLAVLVSDVEADAAAGRRDLLAHAHVLEWLVEARPVVPVQFGIALADEDAVKERLLREERASLEHLLAVFRGFVQLTVQAFHHEEAALREVMRRRPDLVDLRDEIRTVGSVDAQPLQVALGREVATELDELGEEDRTLVLDRLAPLARAVAEHDSGGEPEVAHLAFLVERRTRDYFDEAVGALTSQAGERLRVRYVGPQPPYSFLEAAQTGELAWD